MDPEEATLEEFTQEELGKADGSDGQRALVAVGGKVYDVSSSRMWKGGKHVKAHQAGRELDLQMKAAPHSAEVLERFEQVGNVVDGAPVASSLAPSAPPALFAKILANHPHPLSVHFPIALTIAASLFLVVGLIFEAPAFEQAALFNLCCGLLATPPAIAAGFLSWWYNYSGIMTAQFRGKIILSVVYVVGAAVAIGIRLLVADSPAVGPVYWAYVGIVLALSPTVMATGFLGGKITFPS